MARVQTPVPDSWPLQTAKDQLSRLVKAAADAPQTVTVHGKVAAIVVSPAEYQRLRKLPHQALSSELLRPGLLRASEALFERDRDDNAHRDKPL